MRLALQLELPSRASLLPVTRRAVAGYMEEIGASKDEIEDVLLAVAEACANAIRHAKGRYTVSVVLTDDDAVIEVTDAGGGGAFPVDELTPQVLNLTEHGRGLQIIQGVMNTVEVESPTELGGTRVTMSKHLDAQRG